MIENHSWFIVNTLLMLVYGAQHTLLTTKTAVDLFNRILPQQLWNISYSIISIILIIVVYIMWQDSEIVIYHSEGIFYYAAVSSIFLALAGFFYCFKYTTSFWQWIGIEQARAMLTKSKSSDYYRVRKYGPKKYVRFPHHTCLILLFWSQPVMTLDSLWLAIFATIYIYIGTIHQDSRGRRLLGKEWITYSKETKLIFPDPALVFRDLIKGNLGKI